MTAAFHARILVVDDEPSAAREIAEQLRAFGCEVLGIATTSQQALEFATRAVPDLVLLEQRVSAGDGATASAALRERLGVPVVQISGQAPELRSAIESALERARLEHHLRSLQRKAEATERSAALGTLAAGLARKLESPLDFVIGNQQYAQRELGALREFLDGLTPKRRALAVELVSEIESALRDSISGVEKLRSVVVQLKRLGQPLASEPRLLDVRHLLDAALAITGAELAARARVVREFRVCPKVYADEVRLITVFVNLLKNAAQSIEIGALDSHEIRIVTSTSSQGGALIEVRDTGSGVATPALSRIFEPFFTTRNPEACPGLGLSIAHGIVSGLGGSIEVDSHVEAGSTFRVLLPSVAEPHSTPAASARPTTPTRPRRADAEARLLFVDDEPILLDALLRALEGNYAVDRASGGHAALELLAAGNEYDLLVCDLMMPGMTGMDLFNALEARFPRSARRMAFMTGGAFTLPAQEFIGVAGRRVLEKPFTNDELFAFIAACLKQ